MEIDIDDFIKYLKPPISINILDIGIHNMYENPFTEILAFILKNDETYTNKMLIIEKYFKGLINENTVTNSFLKELYVKTQVQTRNKKYIDMIIYNDDYVIVLENKTISPIDNPFDEYESEINLRFPNQYKYNFLFTIKKEEEFDKWKNVLIGNVFLEIDKILPSIKHNKWDYFINDFIKYYIKESRIMTDGDFNFCNQNISKLKYCKKLFEDYIINIIYKIKNFFNPYICAEENWKDIIAIKLQLMENRDPKIDLIFENNDLFSIQIYYDLISGKTEYELKEIVGDKYEDFVRESECIFFKLRKDYFCKLTEAFDEIKIQWDKMKKIYT